MNEEDPIIDGLGDGQQTPDALGMPWSAIHERKLSLASHSRDLGRDGLVDRESITSFPEGYLVLWDVSGFTKIMKALPPQRQVTFVQDILRVAVKMALDLGLTMLAPPAGDQGIYFARTSGDSDQASLLARYMQNELKIQNPLKPSEFCEVKATVIPASENALFAMTLLDHQREGVSTPHGYHAVAGRAYVQGLAVLQTAVKNSTTVLNEPIVGIPGRFDRFDPSEVPEEGALGEGLAQSVSSVCYPHVPEGPHHYGVFRVKKHVDLIDPSHTVVLSRVLFDAVADHSGVKVQRQDEGYAHVTVEEQAGVDQVIGAITNEVSQVLRALGLELHAHWREVRTPNVFRYGPVQETAGGVVVDIVKGMKQRDGHASRLAM